MSVLVHAVNRPGLAPYMMSDRFRTEIAYFMSLPGEAGVPPLASGEYWVAAARARDWLDEGTFRLVSPLDSGSQAEIELSEEQEAWLEWLVNNQIEHVRLTTAD
jgi:hypothetical protein